MELIVYIFIFLFGLAVGSFLNCLIYRLEIGEKPTGSSFCPSCKHDLSAKDLFPVFSYIFLKGKCRYCGEKISIQYPLVEVFTGVIFLAALLFLSVPYSYLEAARVVLTLIIFSLLVVVFVYDLKHFIIPNKVIYPAIGAAFLLALMEGITLESFFTFLNYIIVGVAFFAFFLAIYLLTKGKGIGFGDVRYSLFLGLFLGFPEGLVALFFSFVIGAIIGVILMASGSKGRKDAIPFGPFLVIGTFIGFFLGELLLNLYFSILL